jgi:hypothetical protein
MLTVFACSQIAEIREQVDRIKHDPGSLPPEHRAVPGGPSSVLIDHPRVVEVIHEIIGPDIRIEAAGGPAVRSQPLHKLLCARLLRYSGGQLRQLTTRCC